MHVHAEYDRSRESVSVSAHVTYDVPQAVRDETGVEDDEQMMREPEHLEVRPPAQHEHGGDVNLGKYHSTSHFTLLRSLKTTCTCIGKYSSFIAHMNGTLYELRVLLHC